MVRSEASGTSYVSDPYWKPVFQLHSSLPLTAASCLNFNLTRETLNQNRPVKLHPVSDPQKMHGIINVIIIIVY